MVLYDDVYSNIYLYRCIDIVSTSEHVFFRVSLDGIYRHVFDRFDHIQSIFDQIANGLVQLGQQ